ncbi:MAG: hypothetical protein HY538_02175 [Deltaproteobacteria bacterium]|nr:hypothetical protein [Deltaproteobacteria bacterium]
MKSKPRIFFIAIFTLLFSLDVMAEKDNITYKETLKGKSCKSGESESQVLSCNYKVGKDLFFSIDGIGNHDTGITVWKSSGSDGDFYMTFGLMHQCAIVKPGRKTNVSMIGNMAFVSPKHGKVYEDWISCEEGL